MGRLGQDPELRQTSGDPVVNISVATSEEWKDKQGEKQQRTEWHRIVAWGKKAEAIDKYFNKGDMIYLEGKLQTRKWEDKDGNDRYTTEIVLREFEFCGGKKDGNSGGSGGSSSSGGGGSSQPPQDFGGSNSPDEDIPF